MTEIELPSCTYRSLYLGLTKYKLTKRKYVISKNILYRHEKSGALFLRFSIDTGSLSCLERGGWVRVGLFCELLWEGVEGWSKINSPWNGGGVSYNFLGIWG